MLDTRFIRENRGLVEEGLQARSANPEILEKFWQADMKWREKLMLLENRRAEQKKQSKGKPTPEILTSLKKMSEEIKQLETEAKALEEQQQAALLVIPNIPDPKTPLGKSEADNPELRKWGEPRRFDFAPKAHDELGTALGILNFEEAGKISGARFAVYHGKGAKLERALINFMLDVHTKEHGYEEIMPPALVNAKAMTGTGQLPKFKEDLFYCQNEEFYLIPTAEVPVTNLHREEILAGDRLPIKYTAYTPCFRREAGSYGKDTRGLIRQHQFNKVELVKFTKPEDSDTELEKLTNDAEQILQKLGLPYRVVALCTADIGFSARKTYDLEVWFPAQNKYREISSCSSFGDFQARRASIKFKRANDAKPELVHTLNGSGLAVGRCFSAILENFQNADGSITIPEVLKPYLDFDKINGK